jgi:hypothetical protein
MRLREHGERELVRAAQLRLVTADVGVVHDNARGVQAEQRPGGQGDVRPTARLGEATVGLLVREQELLRRDRERDGGEQRDHRRTSGR